MAPPSQSRFSADEEPPQLLATANDKAGHVVRRRAMERSVFSRISARAC